MLPPNSRRALPRALARAWCFALADPAANDPPPGGPRPPADPPPPADPTPPADPSPPTPPADPPAHGFSDDWRERYAGEDEKKLARLARYTSPTAALDALFAAQNRISAGELAPTLGETPTDEEVAAYREARGIPAEAKDYDLTFDDGLVIGDDDRPMIDSFTEAMHGVNAEPGAVRAGVQWWYKHQEQLAEQREERDVLQRDEASAELAAEWGGDYGTNVALIKNVIALAPESVRATLLDGHVRFGDDRSIGNHADILRWLASLGRMSGMAGTYVGGGGAEGQADSVAAEIKAIEAKMGSAEYKKDEKMQARLRELYAYEERHQGRAT